ncbi:MAG: 2-oxoglutarate ferredoxin oxidoreductase subunit alpha, partial [Planctomycetota bacterium]|nr:2-oxoglutarate ferredoxin oxidoreductase subunit alpha [Planctomycetota bacterium]
MTPVMILSDGYIANGAEPWKIPDASSLKPIPVHHPSSDDIDQPFLPYQRDDLLARHWAIPGTPNLMHRIGGLEKEDGTGNVSYDPDNHQHMTNTRAQKVANVAKLIGDAEVDGPETGDLLILSWGGTYGACTTASRQLRAEGSEVAHCHLRWLNPFPANLGEVLRRYNQVVIPELNCGQLRMLIRSRYLVDAIGFNKVKGKPFAVRELVERFRSLLSNPVHQS